MEFSQNSGAGAGAGILPIAKLITLTLIGLILGNPKTQFIPKSTFKLLNNLIFVLFFPCLIFTHLGPIITINTVLQWWFLPVNVIIATLLGCTLGYLVAIICRPPAEYFRLTIFMTGFGNTGNLSVSILALICHNSKNPFGSNCYKFGSAYVLFSQWVSIIMFRFLFYRVMENPPLMNFDQLEKPFVEDETEKTENDENGYIGKILNPGLIVLILTIIIGMVSIAKSYLFGEEAPLVFWTDSIQILGKPMVPLTMVVLGAKLSEGVMESKMGIKTTIGVTVARLLVLPLMGIGVLFVAKRFDFYGDKLLGFVILMQYVTPSGMLLGDIARIRGYGVGECSSLLFWQNLGCLFSISFYLVLYFKVLYFYF